MLRSPLGSSGGDELGPRRSEPLSVLLRGCSGGAPAACCGPSVEPRSWEALSQRDRPGARRSAPVPERPVSPGQAVTVFLPPVWSDAYSKTTRRTEGTLVPFPVILSSPGRASVGQVRLRDLAPQRLELLLSPELGLKSMISDKMQDTQLSRKGLNHSPFHKC